MSFRERLSKGSRDDSVRRITSARGVIQTRLSKAREQKAHRPWVSVIGVPFVNAIANQLENVRTKEPYASDWATGMPSRSGGRQGETKAGLPRSAPQESDSPGPSRVSMCIFVSLYSPASRGKTAPQRLQRPVSQRVGGGQESPRE